MIVGGALGALLPLRLLVLVCLLVSIVFAVAVYLHF